MGKSSSFEELSSYFEELFSSEVPRQKELTSSNEELFPNRGETSEARAYTTCRQSLCSVKAPKTVALALGDAGHNEDSGKDRGCTG